MEQIYFAISQIIENISEHANFQTGKSFKSSVLSPEEGLKKDWESVGNDIKIEAENFKKENYEKLKSCTQ
jgi:hypothetical protein|nr:MAG TPA: hypothetical protein [Caudoviricetes sp.]